MCLCKCPLQEICRQQTTAPEFALGMVKVHLYPGVQLGQVSWLSHCRQLHNSLSVMHTRWPSPFRSTFGGNLVLVFAHSALMRVLLMECGCSARTGGLHVYEWFFLSFLWNPPSILGRPPSGRLAVGTEYAFVKIGKRWGIHVCTGGDTERNIRLLTHW